MKISLATLVNLVTGSIKMPTGEAGDKAISVNQIRDYTQLGMFHMRRGNGRAYTSAVNQAALTTQIMAASSFRAFPIIIGKKISVASIVTEITAGVGGSVYRVGIYSDDGNCYPKDLVAGSDLQEYSSNGAAINTGVFVAPIVLEPGLYWLVVLTSAGPTFRALAVASMPPVLGIVDTIGASASAIATGWFVALAYGPLPAQFPAGAATLNTFTPILIAIVTS